LEIVSLRIYCKLKIVNCKLVDNPPVKFNFFINRRVKEGLTKNDKIFILN